MLSGIVGQVFLVLVLSLGVRWSVRRVKILAKIGDVILAYALGIVVRNLALSFWQDDVLEKISSLAIPPALILMLAQSSPRRLWQGGRQLLTAWLFQVLSVLIAAIVAVSLWQGRESAAELGALAVSVYTGGIINLALLSQALGLPPERFGQINLADIAAGAIYLFAIMNLGRFVFRHQEETVSDSYELPESKVPPRATFRQHLWPLLVALALLGAAYGVSLLVGMKDDPRLVLVLITVAGLALSAWPALRRNQAATVQSEFLITVFSLSMGLMANLRNFTAGVLPILLFLFSVLMLSVMLHFTLCRLFRLPDGLFVATSAGGIMSPPFVPSICRAALYPAWIPFGVAAGLAGNSVGTLLGLAFYEWLGGVAI